MSVQTVSAMDHYRRDEILLNDDEDVVKTGLSSGAGQSTVSTLLDMAKMTGRRDYVADLAKEYGADGIIYEQMKFCGSMGI